MGSSQSQQEEREVTVEEDPTLEQGSFRVTEGFVGYLKDKVAPEREGEGEEEDNDKEEDDEEEADTSNISAETITAPLRRDFTRSRGSPRGRAPQYTHEGGASSSTESLHWKEKFQTEKEKNEFLKTVTSREFDSVVGEVRDKLNRQVPQLVPACENFKEKVSDCYLDNPGRPLTCREEVKAYMACVQSVQRGERPDTTSNSASSAPSPPDDKSKNAKNELPILPQPS